MLANIMYIRCNPLLFMLVGWFYASWSVLTIHRKGKTNQRYKWGRRFSTKYEDKIVKSFIGTGNRKGKKNNRIHWQVINDFYIVILLNYIVLRGNIQTNWKYRFPFRSSIFLTTNWTLNSHLTPRKSLSFQTNLIY